MFWDPCVCECVCVCVCVCVCARVLSCSVVSNSMWPHGLYPTRLLCPWGFSRQEYWSGFRFLLQGIFLSQEWNPCLLHWQADSLPLYPLERPLFRPKERNRDGKNSKGPKRSEREGMAMQRVPLALYRRWIPPHLWKLQFNSPLHSESLFILSP